MVRSLKVILLSILVLVVFVGITQIYAQESETTIPSWVKAVADHWSNDRINDSEFIEALEFLIDNRVINLGERIVVDMSEQEDPFGIKQDDDKTEEQKYDESIAYLDSRYTKEKQEWIDKYNLMVEKLEKERNASEKQTEEYYKKVLDKKDLLIKKYRDQYKNAVGMKTE